MADIIDIFDADLRPLGSMDRKQAHREGHWHRTFHCWVVRGGPEPAVLFQLRAPRMRNFPNVLDVSAAGHIETGESVSDGIREVTEELGISIDELSVVYIGDRIEVADQTNGQHNREYQAVHILRWDSPGVDFRPDPHEVWGVYWLDISDGRDLFSGRADSATIEGIVYDDDAKAFRTDRRVVSTSDFLPRIQRYYMAGLIACERLLEGQSDIAIS